MSKILFLTDTHLGARNSSSIFRQLFREYYRDVLFPYIEQNDIKTLIHLGDVFDSRTSLSLQDIDYVMNEFIPLIEQSGVDLHIIAGNHDVAFRNTNKINSLSIFAQCKNVHVYDEQIHVIETQGKNFVLCPWINNENKDTLFEELSYYANKDHVLCGHLEVIGSLMYKNSKACEHGIEPAKFEKFDRVLSGHFHHPSVYGNIEYIGALFHYNWQDHGDWRGFTVYDPTTDEYEKIENEFCLFTHLQYSQELIETDHEDLQTLCEGQFVRLQIDEEHDKVELKDLIAKIERCQPIKVDVIDNTITQVEVTESDESSSTKEIHEYVDEALKEHPHKEALSKMFDSVYNIAKENMRTVE